MRSSIEQSSNHSDFFGQTDLEQTDSAKVLSGFWRIASKNIQLLHQTPPIQHAQRNLPIPLSFNQERLWKVEQLQPNTCVHNILHSFRLTGELNIEAFQQSLNEICRRHEILRTIFTIESGQPVQVILPVLSITIDLVDLCEVPTEKQQVEIEKYAIAQAEIPFDLSQAPLWRVSLLQLAKQEYVLLRTIHHIIFDGMSHSIFMRELGALYSAFASGKPSPLLDLPVQYADFAWTQRQWLQGELLALQLDYWQNYLSGIVSPLILPTDYPRSHPSSYHGSIQSKTLSSDLTRALKTLSADFGVSLFVTLFSAFNILLHQHTGQDNLVICSPVAGRHCPETRGLIGYFNNVIVLRTNLSGDPRFCELLERVNTSFIEGITYQDAPLQLIADLPSLKRIPLTRAMFVLQNTPIPSLNLAGLSVSSVYANREIANFDLVLSLSEQNSQLIATLQYKKALFQLENITHFLKKYEQLLDQLTVNPELKLSSLENFKMIRSEATYIARDRDRFDPLDQPNPISDRPRHEREQQLATLWERALGIESVGIHDNFFELGGHSLLAVSLFHELEQQFGKRLPLSTLITAPTIAQLAEYLDQHDGSSIREQIVLLKQGSGYPPVFLVHDGDGEILLYQQLANHLSADVPVYGIQPYSANNTPISHTRVAEMVTDYIEKIRQIQPQGPYFLGGLCAGGVLAFEIARQLQLQGQAIGMVAIIDAADVEAVEKAGYVVSQRRNRFLKVFRDNQQLPAYQRGLSIVNQVRKKVTNLLNHEIQKQYKASRDRIQFRLFQYYLDHQLSIPQWLPRMPVRTILVQALGGYVPDTVFQGDVLLFRATEKSHIFDGMQFDDTPYVDLYQDPLLGWGQRVSQTVRTYDIPGGHSSILQNPNVSVIADIIQTHWENRINSRTKYLYSNTKNVA